MKALSAPFPFDFWRRAIALAAIAVGAAVLVGGWWLDVALLRQLHPGYANMKANTAAALIAAGLSLWLLREHASAGRRRAGQMAALVAALIGGLTLTQYLFGWNLGIDEWLVADTVSGYGTPGRIAPNTALALVLVASSLLLLDRPARGGSRPGEWLTLGGGMIALLGVIGYVYGAPSLYRLSIDYAMALHSALTLLLLAIGTLLARPRTGLMAIVTSDSAGGALARRLLPWALLAPPLLGWLRILGERAGLYDPLSSIALLSTANVAIILAIIGWTTRSHHRLDILHSANLAKTAILSNAVEQTADSVVITDREGRIEYVNPAFERTSGYRSGEAMGRSSCLVKSGQHPLSFYKGLWLTVMRGEPFRAVFVNRRKDGSLYHEQKTITPIKDGAGTITHFVATGKDISEQMRQQGLLRESEARFRATFEQAAVGMAHVAPNGRWLRVNQRLCDIVDYPRDELLQKTFQDITHPDDLEADLAQVGKMLAGELSTYTMEKRYLRKDGAVAWVNLTVALVRAASGTPDYFISVIEDIGERKRAERELEHLAHHDPLTGLPNRLLFTELLLQAMADAERRERLVGVALLDLDQFKNINDSLGHATGDALLKQVGERLSRTLRSGDTVARIGGDEFALIFANMANVEDANLVLQKIRVIFDTPFPIDGRELFITASTGVTLYPFDDRDAQALLRNADVAMYHSKASGRNAWQYYAAEMTTKASDNLMIETELRGAIERRELEVHYQPQVNLVTGRITGVEALLRWRSARLGNIPPDRFIPIAEENGQIVPIGEWVLRAACEQAQRWRDAGFTSLRLAVNLSSRQLNEPDLMDVVERVLAETGFPADMLELELTESILLRNVSDTIAALDRLSILGVRLAIDDFGTGYSSLAYLRRFPVDVLKIDQSFTRHVTSSRNSASIVRAIITLARALDLEIVAEGVETAEQRAFLADSGCHAIQGFYISKPQPAEAISRMLLADNKPALLLQGEA